MKWQTTSTSGFWRLPRGDAMTRALLTLAQAGALLACFGTWAVFLGLFT
jgi:hypothetical protein